MAGKRLTKAQVIAELANASDLDKKSVGRVFEGAPRAHPQATLGSWPRGIRSSGSGEAPRGEEAGDERASRHQSLHQGADHDPGEAREQEGSRDRSQEPQRPGSVSRPRFGAANDLSPAFERRSGTVVFVT
jgi:hypothetical protein